MASTRLGYLALKKESTLPPTVTPIKPSHFIRFKDGDVQKNLTILANSPIQNQRWKAIQPVSTTEAAEGSYNVDLDPNEVPYWLMCALGTLVSTDISSLTDASVFKHTFTVANQLPSLTVEQGKGNIDDTTSNRQKYTIDRAFGVMVDTLTMAASDGIINVEVALKAHGVFQMAKMIADAAAGSNVNIALDTVEGLTTADTVNIEDNTPQNETDAIASISTSNKTIQIATLGNSYTVADLGKVELIPQTPSYATDPRVFTFKDVSFQFGDDLTAAASATEENVEDWEFSYENQLEERYGSLRAAPSVVAPKWAIAKLKFTKYFETVLDRDRYLRTLKRACIITITDNVIVSATDTNNAKYTTKILINDLRYTQDEMPTGNDDLYIENIEAECFYDSTDGKAIQVEVINGKAGTVYTA